MNQSSRVEVHLLAGEAGCRWARAQKAVAVVVDALRASATITVLLQQGAAAVVAVKEIGEAYAYRASHPEVLLVGERGGLKVDGFDFGNSPTELRQADLRGRQVIFTSTTGAQRLVDCLGASAIVVGTTINATAVARQVASFARVANVPIVIIPAGLATHPESVAEEDWLGATTVASRIGLPVNQASIDAFQYYRGLIDKVGLLEGFLHSAHGQHLVQLGFADDIQMCAQVDLITDTVPTLSDVVPLPCGGQGVRLQRGMIEHATPL